MTDQDIKVRLDDIIVWAFAFWPFFWSTWGLFHLPSRVFGYALTSLVLYALTMVTVILRPKLPVSVFLPWIAFLVVVAAENARRMTPQFKQDIPVMICAIIVCMAVSTQKFDRKGILWCLFGCGLIISLSVITDTATGIFRHGLFGLLNAQTVTLKKVYSASGGLLVFTGAAGCFIFSGVCAFFALAMMRGGKKRGLLFWGVIAQFAFAAILIQKRGFLLDFALGVVVLLILQIRKDQLGRINLSRLLITIALGIVIIAGFASLYLFIPMVREAVDSLIGRFTGSDSSLKTLSGRTQLYELALKLHRNHFWTGIGWGRFRLNSAGVFSRSSDITYAVHNVYLQILCETGAIGLAAFLAAVSDALLYGCLRYRKLFRSDPDSEPRYAVGAGVFLQVFFLAYCMSGNPLYDYNFLITYFIGILLTLPGCEKKESTDRENVHSYIL